MFYRGMSNVPGAPGNNAAVYGPGQLSTDVIAANIPGSSLSDLVYRGEQTEMVPLPYQGGGMNIQQLSQGIPVGQDPRFPMTQQQFRDEMEMMRFKNMFPNRGDFRQYIRDYNKQNPLGRQAELPAGFDGKYVS